MNRCIFCLSSKMSLKPPQKKVSPLSSKTLLGPIVLGSAVTAAEIILFGEVVAIRLRRCGLASLEPFYAPQP
jgi:hypothetical protein